MRLARLAVIIALTTSAAGRDDPERCRQALASYKDVVAAIHAAIRDYEQRVKASIGRDYCGGEFIELQVTVRDFEAAVDERAAGCRALNDASENRQAARSPTKAGSSELTNPRDAAHLQPRPRNREGTPTRETGSGLTVL